MTTAARSDTRAKLLAAAADLVAAAPGGDVSLRDVCDRVGVKMPTLYHFFGSKQGLLDAVVDHGFELYLEAKDKRPSSGDPIQDLRDGWDAHVSFGLEHPGFYTLMYGTVRPGHSPDAQARPSRALLALTRLAAEQGRLVVPADQAAAHVLVTNIGVTLRQIVLATPDPALSAAVREGALAAITGTTADDSLRTQVHRVLELAAGRPEVLGTAETHLLTHWLRRLADTADPS